MTALPVRVVIVVPKDQEPAIAALGRRTVRNVPAGTTPPETIDRVMIVHDVPGQAAGPMTGPQGRLPEANDLRVAKSGRVVKVVRKKKSGVPIGRAAQAKVAAQHG